MKSCYPFRDFQCLLICFIVIFAPSSFFFLLIYLKSNSFLIDITAFNCILTLYNRQQEKKQYPLTTCQYWSVKNVAKLKYVSTIWLTYHIFNLYQLFSQNNSNEAQKKKPEKTRLYYSKNIKTEVYYWSLYHWAARWTISITIGFKNY